MVFLIYIFIAFKFGSLGVFFFAWTNLINLNTISRKTFYMRQFFMLSNQLINVHDRHLYILIFKQNPVEFSCEELVCLFTRILLFCTFSKVWFYSSKVTLFDFIFSNLYLQILMTTTYHNDAKCVYLFHVIGIRNYII